MCYQAYNDTQRKNIPRFKCDSASSQAKPFFLFLFFTFFHYDNWAQPLSRPEPALFLEESGRAVVNVRFAHSRNDSGQGVYMMRRCRRKMVESTTRLVAVG